MDVRNCRSCKRLFNYVAGPPICERCKAELEDKFQVVKEYIRDHTDAPMQVVAQECDVSVKQLREWVREERLVFSEESGVFLECETCGKPIRMGRYCQSCKAKLENELRKATYVAPVADPQGVKSKGKDKMRFLDT